MFSTRLFRKAFIAFIVLNLGLYFFIFFFNSSIPFHEYNYYHHFYHFFTDPRIHGNGFDFFQALGYSDAQWYLQIAERGYPTVIPRGFSPYAFFPLYPLILAFFNLLFHDIHITAFIVTNIVLYLDFISLYYVITKLYSSKLAARTIFLFFLFPFSIFYRSYFTEGLFLLMLIWFSYFLIKKKWFFAMLILSFLYITRPNGLLLAPIFYTFFILHNRKDLKNLFKKLLLYVPLNVIPFLLWCYLCFVKTGNSFYWYEAQKAWYNSPSIFHTFYSHFTHLLSFWKLHFHDFSNSQVEYIIMLLVITLLIMSKKYLKPELWWICVVFCIPLLFLKDTLSFTRYQMTSFPLFIFLAQRIQGPYFIAVSGVFGVLLFLVSLYFINWFWVG